MIGKAALAAVIAAVALIGWGLATGAGGRSWPPRGNWARLRVDYQADNTNPRTEHWTLVCGAKAAGTHPQPALACDELAAHPDALRLPRSKVCPMIMIAGDPDATVTGTVNGTAVNLHARPQCPVAGWMQLQTLITGR